MTASDTSDAGGFPDGHTFAWRDARRPRHFRIIFFIALSAFLHAGFFYLFRVTSGVREQPVPRPESIVLLHQSHPLAAPLIEKLIARAAPYSGSLRSSASGALHLSEFAPTYTPSFSGYVPPLAPFPEPDRTVVLPRLFGDGVPKLPAAEAPESWPPPLVSRSHPSSFPARSGSPVLDFSPNLQARAPEVGPLDRSAWPDEGGRHTLSVTVAASGRIVHLLPVGGEVVPDLVDSDLRAIRFAPGRAETGTLNVTW